MVMDRTAATAPDEDRFPRRRVVPTYEYACKECEEHLEVQQSFSEPALTVCPSCGGPLRKVFGNIAITFKGSGFYKTDSRAANGASKSGAAKGARAEGSSSSDGGSASSGGSTKTAGPESALGASVVVVDAAASAGAAVSAPGPPAGVSASASAPSPAAAAAVRDRRAGLEPLLSP